VQISKEATQRHTKKKLNRAGGDKYGNKTPLTESSTKHEKSIKARIYPKIFANDHG